MNNITVDGSSFNSSFGLGQPAGRPDRRRADFARVDRADRGQRRAVRRAAGSFIGAGVNTVTRSGANHLSGAFYHRFRDQDWVGTEARPAIHPGTFKFRNTGGWASGPIVQNKWFAFGNYEDEMDTRPLSTCAQPGRRADRRQRDARARVRHDRAQRVPGDELQLRDGPFNDLPDETPAKRFLLRSDYNLNN